MSYSKIILFIFSGFMVMSCSVNGNLKNKKDGMILDIAEFKQQKNKWEKKKIENYEFRYKSPGFANQDYTVTVKNDRVVNIKRNDPSLAEGAFCRYTINGFFSSIESLYEYEKNKIRTESQSYLRAIIISYDPEYGFPNEATFDYVDPPGLQVDGNKSFSISQFKILP